MSLYFCYLILVLDIYGKVLIAGWGDWKCVLCRERSGIVPCLSPSLCNESTTYRAEPTSQAGTSEKFMNMNLRTLKKNHADKGGGNKKSEKQQRRKSCSRHQGTFFPAV